MLTRCKKQVHGLIAVVLCAGIMFGNAFSLFPNPVVKADTSSDEITFEDDFSRAGEDELGDGWVYSAGMATVFEEQLQLKTGVNNQTSTDGFTNYLLTRDISETFLEQIVTVDVPCNELAAGRIPAIWLRVQKPGSSSEFTGYVLTYSSPDFCIWRLSEYPNGTRAYLSGTATRVYASYFSGTAKDTVLRITFSASGSNPTRLEYTLNFLGTSWVINKSFEDSTAALQNPGTVGLSARSGNQNDSILFDNFSYSNNANFFVEDTFSDGIGNNWSSTPDISYFSTQDNRLNITVPRLLPNDVILKRPDNEAALVQTVKCHMDADELAAHRFPIMWLRMQNKDYNGIPYGYFFYFNGSALRFGKSSADGVQTNLGATYFSPDFSTYNGFDFSVSASRVEKGSSELTVEVFCDLKDGADWIKTFSVVDSDKELQNPGTVGMSGYSSVKDSDVLVVDDFVYRYVPYSEDNELTILSLIRLKKYLSDVTYSISDKADYNEDDVIDSGDMVILCQHLLGMEFLGQQQQYFANSHKLLAMEKRLTIGYLGGSITLGVSADKAYNGNGTFAAYGTGDLTKSWVNLTSKWFRDAYPDCTIETVNAGVSDTATNYGLYRLEKMLMNTDGHDMPDLIFVEFTNNDWITTTQNGEDLRGQIESLFRNIYRLNPYAEIVVAVTARSAGDPSRAAYKAVADKYGIPMIDMGIPLGEKIRERIQTTTETAGNYYYTIDNLHPSIFGYAIYFEEIQKFLAEKWLPYTPANTYLKNYNKNIQSESWGYKFSNPTIIEGNVATIQGAAVLNKNATVNCNCYGTDLIVDTIPVTSTRVDISGECQLTFQFSGEVLGLLFQMTSETITIHYSIDGSDAELFEKSSYAGHSQVYMLSHHLSKGNHTVVLQFSDNNPGSALYFGGIITNG